MGNFWGDMDGDGQETPRDDMLGDMVMYDNYRAQEREQRGEPPDDEDEDLLGYHRPGPYRSPSYAGGAKWRWPTALLLMALLGGCLLMFLCALLGQ